MYHDRSRDVDDDNDTDNDHVHDYDYGTLQCNFLFLKRKFTKHLSVILYVHSKDMNKFCFGHLHA